MALVRTGAILFAGLVGLLGGGSGTVLVLAINAWWPRHLSETAAVLITGLLGTSVAFIAVVIAVWGVVSSRAIARRQTTLDHIARTEADGSIQAAQKEFNALTRAGSLASYADKEHEGTPQLQAIVTILNQFELVSIGIQRGIIEPELYNRWYRSQVLLAWKNAQPFVVALRARVDRPSLYHEFEEMARWINQNRMPRRRFWWAGII